jgi:hypothetical protein
MMVYIYKRHRESQRDFGVGRIHIPGDLVFLLRGAN